MSACGREYGAEQEARLAWLAAPLADATAATGLVAAGRTKGPCPTVVVPATEREVVAGLASKAPTTNLAVRLRGPPLAALAEGLAEVGTRIAYLVALLAGRLALAVLAKLGRLVPG